MKNKKTQTKDSDKVTPQEAYAKPTVEQITESDFEDSVGIGSVVACRSLLG